MGQLFSSPERSPLIASYSFYLYFSHNDVNTVIPCEKDETFAIIATRYTKAKDLSAGIDLYYGNYKIKAYNTPASLELVPGSTVKVVL